MQKSVLACVAVFLLTGCAASSANLLAQNQTSALQAARDRARFDQGCLDPTATMVTGEVVAPPVGQGKWVAGGRQIHYVVDVAGCGKTSTYNVYCAEAGAGCTAVDKNNPSSQNN